MKEEQFVPPSFYHRNKGVLWMELTQGVNLTVIPSKKFKTIHIKMTFKRDLTKDIITSRSLLSRLLERNSEEYPTQTDLQQALSNLYGAGFSTTVSRTGNIHTLAFNMRIVNDEYLQEDHLTQGAINFLKSVLLKPNASNGQFDQKTFDREVQNLKDDIESIYDDKQYYAKQAMLKEYFTDPKQSTLLSGTLEDLKTLTSQSLYETYQDMLANDEVDIMVLGDVNEEEITDLFKNFNLEPRQTKDRQVFYQNGSTSLTRKEEVQEVVQAKLNLAYDTGIYYLTEDYFALQVFNGLFGGFPSSKLFTNVREKESLAYYASSNIDATRGALYIRSGIDKKEADRVIDLVGDQLEAIQAGDFSDEVLRQTKEQLKNGLRQSEDSPSRVINGAYTRKLVETDLDIDQWIQKIDGVSRDEVIQVAKNIELKTIFLLKGE